MSNRILVVYYSRTGTALRVATHLAHALGADMDRIVDGGSRDGLLGYMRSGFEAVTKSLPMIRTRKDPRDYDLVIIGTPVWAGSLSSPVRSYLFEYQAALPRAAFFTVMDGRGGEQVLQEMRSMAHSPWAPGYAALRKDVENGHFRPVCDAFAAELRRQLPQSRLPFDAVAA